MTLSASARSSLPYAEKSLVNVFHWPLNERLSLRDRIRLKILGILRHYTSDTGPHLLPGAFIINIIDVKANRVAKTPPPTAAPHLTSQIGKIHQAATALPKTNSPKTSVSSPVLPRPSNARITLSACWPLSGIATGARLLIFSVPTQSLLDLEYPTHYSPTRPLNGKSSNRGPLN